MKINRNEQCPCGSGKKYKKCCGLNFTSEPNKTNGHQRLNIDSVMRSASADCESGRLEQAASQYHRILEQKPHYADAHFHLGLVYIKQANYNDAINALNRAIKKNKKDVRYYNALGYLYIELGSPIQAIKFLNKAIQLNHKYADAYINRGRAFKAIQLLDKALADYSKARSINPNSILAQINFLYTLNFISTYTCKEIADEHILFGKRYSKAVQPVGNVCVDKGNSHKRLKIGYISQDFRQHSVAYFIEPIMRHHDHDQFEVFAYYNGIFVDATTERLRGYCDHWREIYTLSDDELVDIVAQDSIDILVDLSGYTVNTRVLAFSRRLAPLQVTWIGYPNTTGLPAMDYRISDEFSDPLGTTEHLYSENIIRLPECFLCYQPPESSPDISELPAIENDYITFGSFNNPSKITEGTLKVWSEIFQQIPNAKLLLKSKVFNDKKMKSLTIDKFSKAGFDKNRILFLESSTGLVEHLDAYSQMDIALDTFPYNGTTTTCEALWMGTPVIVLAGECHRSRVGVSLLTATNLEELICSNEIEYVKKAVRLATEIKKIEYYKTNLRNQLSTSNLMNAERFTKHLENSYRSIWKEKCKHP